jgi:hypothetical protein
MNEPAYLENVDPGDETQPPRRHVLNPYANRCARCGKIADWCGGLAGPCIPEPESEPCP